MHRDELVVKKKTGPRPVDNFGFKPAYIKGIFMSIQENLAILHLRMAMNTQDKPKLTSLELQFKELKGHFYFTQKCWRIQIPGRPWVFEASYHPSLFKCKLGTYFLEDGKVNVSIDDMDLFVFRQPNPIENFIFTE